MSTLRAEGSLSFRTGSLLTCFLYLPRYLIIPLLYLITLIYFGYCPSIFAVDGCVMERWPGHRLIPGPGINWLEVVFGVVVTGAA